MFEERHHARATLLIRFATKPESESVDRRRRFEQDAQRIREHLEVVNAWVREHRMENHVAIIDAVPATGMVVVQADHEGERHLRGSDIPAEILEVGQLDIDLL